MAISLERFVNVEVGLKELRKDFDDWLKKQSERDEKSEMRKDYYTKLVVGGLIVFFMTTVLNGLAMLVGLGLTVFLNADKVTALLAKLWY